MESEQNRENNTSEIAHRTDRAAEDTVGVRVDVWDEGEIGTVISVLVRKKCLRMMRRESHTRCQLPRRTPCQRSARTLWFRLVG
jgi:hypothetical protein